MDKDAVVALVAGEVGRLGALDNLHGITARNIAAFLVEPHEILVDPDDGGADQNGSPLRTMWLVLEEKRDQAYAIAFDPQENGWAVVERCTSAGEYVQITGGPTLAAALTGM